MVAIFKKNIKLLLLLILVDQSLTVRVYGAYVAVSDAKLVSYSHGSKKCDEFHLVWSLSHLFTLCGANGYITLLLPIV